MGWHSKTASPSFPTVLIGSTVDEASSGPLAAAAAGEGDASGDGSADAAGSNRGPFAPVRAPAACGAGCVAGPAWTAPSSSSTWRGGDWTMPGASSPARLSPVGVAVACTASCDAADTSSTRGGASASDESGGTVTPADAWTAGSVGTAGFDPSCLAASARGLLVGDPSLYDDRSSAAVVLVGLPSATDAVAGISSDGGADGRDGLRDAGGMASPASSFSAPVRRSTAPGTTGTLGAAGVVRGLPEGPALVRARVQSVVSAAWPRHPAVRGHGDVAWPGVPVRKREKAKGGREGLNVVGSISMARTPRYGRRATSKGKTTTTRRRDDLWRELHFHGDPHGWSGAPYSKVTER